MPIKKFRPLSPDPAVNKIKGDTEFARLAHLNKLIDDINSSSLVGPAGPQGIQGPVGPQGAPGPVGPAGLNWQGAWSASGTYVVDDAVGYNGASWFCINAVGPSAVPPDTDTVNWALLAAQGATGPAGATGAQGPTGPQGPAGGATYSVYTAVIDTVAFTATVLENTLGVTLTISNPSNGVIRLTSPSPIFLTGKTFILASSARDAVNDAYFVLGQRGAGFFGDTRIDFTIRKFDNTQTFTPSLAGGMMVEIRVYP